MIQKNTKVLDSLLSFYDLIPDLSGVTEIMINKPHEMIYERFGKMTRVSLPKMTFNDQINLASIIAGHTGQKISQKTPLISGTLPTHSRGGGERVQIVRPPACEANHVIICLRIPSPMKISMEEYKSQGAFDKIKNSYRKDKELSNYYKNGDYYNFIKLCVKKKLNIMNSGGTGTGKTTFTNALVDLIDKDERIITIEDSREIQLKQENKVHLLSSKGDQGVSNVGFRELLEASLRLRPDRILQSEIRDASAYYYLKGINTGHPGSISTVHADSAENAITSINMLVMQANLGWSIKDIDSYVRSVLDVIIQWQRKGNKRYISEILWLGANNA